ncbi:ComF family protein [Paracoccus sp. S-4012]|uniref:double zinc ribbon domain-containing protein n=1 Tax=Paracoccus sp. S-4012 TaxID=2665648 RepID=UPI0012B0BEB1|nr:double zinc ribbon domain-containing protein [Paracoccus sp. S-4012]MRX49277.1 ComF family protein [Paracoccus sp. S-4012]
MGAEPSAIGAAWKGALRLIYPPQCPACDTPVAEDGGLCPGCWREAGFITGAACDACGSPLPSPGEGAAGMLVCDDCMALARPWARGVAALRYSGTGRRLVLALKHGDRPDLAPLLGRWLADAVGAAEGAVVVPVPVHPRRLLRRRYNQAALIGAAVARRLGLAHRPSALRRLRHTPMQDHRSLADRFENQRGAIGVSLPDAARIAGRPVLLVDDVMASGATMAAAAEALTAAGAGPITAAVVARAVKDD